MSGMCARRGQTNKRKILLEESLKEKIKIDYSPHLSLYAEFIGCDPAKLQDADFITLIMLSSILQGRMKLIDFFLKKFEMGGAGITAVALISDSHIIVNTFPEFGFLTLDVYACSGYIMNVLNEFVRMLKPKKFDFILVPRILKKAAIKPKIILNKSNVKDKQTRTWLLKKQMLPLLNNSEELFSLASIVGFVFATGRLQKNKLIIRQDRHVLEILKERLKKFGINPKIRPKNNSFELIVTNKKFCKLLSLLGVPKNAKELKLPWWIDRENLPIAAAFLSSLLFSEISKNYEKVRKSYTVFSRTLKNKQVENFFKKIGKLLKSFNIANNIVISKSYKGKTIELKIKNTKENWLRMQALLSLPKIVSAGILDPKLIFQNNAKMYPKSSKFYKMLKYLIKRKKESAKELFKKIGVSRQTGYKWLDHLSSSNLIKKIKNKKDIIVELNIKC